MQPSKPQTQRKMKGYGSIPHRGPSILRTRDPLGDLAKGRGGRQAYVEDGTEEDCDMPLLQRTTAPGTCDDTYQAAPALGSRTPRPPGAFVDHDSPVKNFAENSAHLFIRKDTRHLAANMRPKTPRTPRPPGESMNDDVKDSYDNNFTYSDHIKKLPPKISSARAYTDYTTMQASRALRATGASLDPGPANTQSNDTNFRMRNKELLTFLASPAPNSSGTLGMHRTAKPAKRGFNSMWAPGKKISAMAALFSVGEPEDVASEDVASKDVESEDVNSEASSATASSGSGKTAAPNEKTEALEPEATGTSDSSDSSDSSSFFTAASHYYAASDYDGASDYQSHYGTEKLLQLTGDPGYMRLLDVNVARTSDKVKQLTGEMIDPRTRPDWSESRMSVAINNSLPHNRAFSIVSRKFSRLSEKDKAASTFSTDGTSTAKESSVLEEEKITIEFANGYKLRVNPSILSDRPRTHREEKRDFAEFGWKQTEKVMIDGELKTVEGAKYCRLKREMYKRQRLDIYEERDETLRMEKEQQLRDKRERKWSANAEAAERRARKEAEKEQKKKNKEPLRKTMLQLVDGKMVMVPVPPSESESQSKLRQQRPKAKRLVEKAVGSIANAAKDLSDAYIAM